jgi:hypothetical protein
VFVFYRAFFTDPKDLPSANQLIAGTRICPHGKGDSAAAMKFPDGSATPAYMLFPHDGSYFDMLARFIEDETVDPTDMDWRGMMAAIGIQKGKPFQPTAHQRELLDKAAKTAFNMSKVEIWNELVNQPGGKYYPDRQWENVFAGQNPVFQASGTFTNLVQRDSYFTSAYATSPGMVADLVAKGAKYPSTWRDSDGNFLEGGNTYQLHLPPDIPAANFWSVTAYDSITASGLENGQPLPSLNSMDKPTQNPDGSYDLYFGPNPRPANKVTGSKPSAAKATSSFCVSTAQRKPSSTRPGSRWKPDDVRKIN